MVNFLPYGRQSVDADDVAAVLGVLEADRLTTGPVVEKFEEAFAAAVGARHAIASSSGTAALHLAVLALGLNSDDAAVVPTLTFVATANAVRLAGAEAIFADVDPDTGLMGPDQLEAAAARYWGGRRLRAAIPMHLNGQPCGMVSLGKVA